MRAECRRVESDFSFLQKIQLYHLYHVSFPRNERKPLAVILAMWRKGKTDIWLLLHQKRLLGFATTINSERLIMLDYLAIDPKQRGRGFGTKILLTVMNAYQDKGLFLEIENTYDPAPEQKRRLKRKRFYIRNGLQELHVYADVFGVRMELLGRNCEMTFDQYHSFYHDHYSAFAADHVKQITPPNT